MHNEVEKKPAGPWTRLKRAGSTLYLSVIVVGVQVTCISTSLICADTEHCSRLGGSAPFF